jgi:hypothetical protein
MKNLFLICLLLIQLPVSAQQEPEKKRTCRVIFPERPQSAPKEAYLFDGEKSQKVILPNLNFSEVIELPLGAITIGMSPDAVSDPEAFPAGAPSVSIPAEHTDLYLLIFTDSKNKVLPIRIQPIYIDKDLFKAGETMWFNFSNRKIAAKLGQAKLLIEPKKRVISKSPLAKSGYYLADFSHKEEKDTEYSPIMRKSWWHDEFSRHIGFVIDAGDRLPKIYMFRDRRSAEAKPNNQ